MLHVNGDDGVTLFLLRRIFAIGNSLQTPCQPETWRRSNKSKDLVDYLCQSGVKQRVFLHVNDDVDTLSGRITGSRMCVRQVSFPVVFTAPAPTKRAAHDFFA